MKTQIITADFSNGTSIYDGIRSKLQGLNIGILGRFTHENHKIFLYELLYEPGHEKTGFLPMRKQRHISASQ